MNCFRLHVVTKCRYFLHATSDEKKERRNKLKINIKTNRHGVYFVFGASTLKT